MAEILVAERENACHGVEDAVETFKNLTDTEKRNLARVAKLLAGHGEFAAADELISEAYIRIADGTRRWPKAQPFVTFLAGVMRSLLTDGMFLTDEQKIKALKHKFAVVDSDEFDRIAAPVDGELAARKAVLEQVMSKLMRHFEGDQEMELLIMGIDDDRRGQALQELIGVDAKRLEALRTRLNRQIDKLVGDLRAKEEAPNER